VVFASASAIASVQVLSEVEQAHKRGKPIYTILIGKPRVSRELDYYISRLHWIESNGASVETLADRLAGVLSGKQSWSETASPPSLRRTVLYRRDAFMGSAAATLAVLLVAGAGLGYWVNSRERGLDQDFRRLGYVSLSAFRSATANRTDPDMRVQGQVWLLAQDLAFRDVTLITVAHNPDGSVERTDRSALLRPEQVGGVEMIDFPLSPETAQLTACLVMPNAGLQERSRVTQVFAVPVVGDNDAGYPIALSPVREPTVSTEDGTLCGSTP
jgi:hypothetical protein